MVSFVLLLFTIGVLRALGYNLKVLEIIKYSSAFLVVGIISLVAIVSSIFFGPGTSINQQIRKRKFNKWFKKDLKWIKRCLYPSLFLLGSCLLFSFLKWFKRLWPHHLFSPEVDAAIITAFFSTATLGITLIVTARFNKQTQLAMLNQSNAQLRESILMHRIEVYPNIEEKIGIIRKMVKLDNMDIRFKETFIELLSYRKKNRYYLSREIKIKLIHLKELAVEIGDGTKYEKAQKNFLKCCKGIIQQIDNELDLGNLIDEDLKILGNTDD
jgi:hypothetical protein